MERVVGIDVRPVGIFRAAVICYNLAVPYEAKGYHVKLCDVDRSLYEKGFYSPLGYVDCFQTRKFISESTAQHAVPEMTTVNDLRDALQEFQLIHEFALESKKNILQDPEENTRFI